MTPPDAGTATAWGVALAAFAAAAFERTKSVKREKKNEQESSLLSDAKMYQERGEILKRLAEENLVLYQREHDEHVKTRDYWHTKAGEFQVTLTKCQDKLTEFEARPDFSVIVEFVRQQALASNEILIGIREILKAIKIKFDAPS